MESIRIWAPTEAGRLGVGVGELVEVEDSVAEEFVERGIASRPDGETEAAVTGPRESATAPRGRRTRR